MSSNPRSCYVKKKLCLYVLDNQMPSPVLRNHWAGLVACVPLLPGPSVERRPKPALQAVSLTATK